MALPCANGMRDVTSMQILVRGRERKDMGIQYAVAVLS